MRTNREKWDHWMELIETKCNAFINQVITEKIPDHLYHVHPNGSITDWLVVGVFYRYDYRHKFPGNVPRKTAIADIEKFYNEFNPDNKDEIYLNLSRKSGTSSVKYSSINGSKEYFPDWETASKKADEVLELNARRTEFKFVHAKDAKFDYQANGYKFLGWQNGWAPIYADANGNVTTDPKLRRSMVGYDREKHPEWNACKDQNHFTIDVQHDNRGSENTVSCPICKIYWKYDCSD